MKRIFFLLLFAGCSLAGSAAPLKIELPRETLTYLPEAGVSLANTRCLTCHSADYVVIQPKLSRTWWRGNVVKMQQKYGADIPENEIDLLADYFSQNYGSEKRSEKPQPQPLVVSEPGQDGSKLVVKYSCGSCHALDRKIVGPSFRDISAKHRSAADARVKLSRQISHGGGGNWGPVPMPPFPQIPASDANAIIDWILRQ